MEVKYFNSSAEYIAHCRTDTGAFEKGEYIVVQNVLDKAEYAVACIPANDWREAVKVFFDAISADPHISRFRSSIVNSCENGEFNKRDNPFSNWAVEAYDSCGGGWAIHVVAPKLCETHQLYGRAEA